MSFEKVKYNTQYNKDNYTEIKFRVPKGRKTIIDAHWKAKGYKSLNSYINDLINKDIGQDAGEGSGKNTDDEKILGGGKMRIAA